MIASPRRSIARAVVPFSLIFAALACKSDEPATAPLSSDVALDKKFNSPVLKSGQEIFRFDTYGNETFWSDTAALHVIINSLKPVDALTVFGLKVDVNALPASLRAQLIAGDVDLEDPANTVALIGLNAVLGVKGEVEDGKVVRVGITCALCHSTVDNSLTGGIGKRLDGWPNRDLDVGKIIAAIPTLPDAPFNSWGPGMYDPRINIDGKNTPLVLPPAFGLRKVAKETYTGDGPVSYWNAYVAITQMHGHGRFVDPRIGVNINNTPPDLVSSKLDALREYQFSLETPKAREGTYDKEAARRGKRVFREAGCRECHSGVIFSDINSGKLWEPEEVGQDPAYADRTATKKYRTTPLRGLWNPPQLDGPYFHDGSAPTLEAVVEHYVTLFELKLTAKQKFDLVEYLKTL
jgi:hypothetical protein